jgi:hypothetical protein
MVRGAAFHTDARYIRYVMKDTGLDAVRTETNRMGYLIDYDKMITTKWYPLNLRLISLLSAKKTFGWDDEKIMNMGRIAPRYSLITKMMLRYFVSLERVCSEVPKYWQKHYTVGRMESELHRSENKIKLRLKEFQLHPIMCTYLSGYYLGVTELVDNFKNLRIEEIKCIHTGDDHHEFNVVWD